MRITHPLRNFLTSIAKRLFPDPEPVILPVQTEAEIRPYHIGQRFRAKQMQFLQNLEIDSCNNEIEVEIVGEGEWTLDQGLTYLVELPNGDMVSVHPIDLKNFFEEIPLTFQVGDRFTADSIGAFEICNIDRPEISEKEWTENAMAWILEEDLGEGAWRIRDPHGSSHDVGPEFFAQHIRRIGGPQSEAKPSRVPEVSLA